MKSNLYVIRDLVAGETGPIFHSVNDAVASRHYQAMVSKNEPAWQTDFQLEYVGEYCHKTGVIFPTGELRIVIVGENPETKQYYSEDKNAQTL